MKFAFFETIGKLIVRYHSFFEEGIINTLIIAAFAVLFGTILGTLMASMRMSRILPLRWIATAYIEFIRGTPLMVQLMFIFYGNEFVTVIKESSIVSVIGLADLMFRTNDVIAVTYKSLPCLAIAALCYFAMTFTGGRIIALAERKMNHGK